MIVCHRCGKENQDHYKFCLGCGAELTGPPKAAGGDMGVMKTMLADVGKPATPAGGSPFGAPPAISPPGPLSGGQIGQIGQIGMMPGIPSISPAPTAGGRGWPPPGDVPLPPPGSPGLRPRPATPAVAPNQLEPAAGPRKCPSCGYMVPPAFKFCGACGFRMPEEQPAAASPAGRMASAVEKRPHAFMTLIRPDGSEGGTFDLSEGENKIGRNHGAIFENDGYLSPTHAIISIRGGEASIRDLESLNGVFVKMIDEEELVPGQIIRVGQELLRFDVIEPPEPLADGTEVMGSPNPGYWGKITVVIGNGVDGSAYPLLGDSVTLGRERGEINFPDDGYVSGLHARISLQNGRVTLADLGSSNGTFIKVKGERKLENDSFVLLGQQLFRISL